MHPHADVRRLVVILTIAVAACAPGGSPGTSPIPGSSVLPATPAATVAASPAASAAAVILPACSDPYALPTTAFVRFLTLRESPIVSMEHVVATSTGPLGFSVPLVGDGAVEPTDVGRAPGNRDISFDVHADPEGHELVMTSARVSLRIGTTPAVDLATVVTGYSPRLTMPDAQGAATIAMTLAWSDGCFTYTGDTTVSVAIDRAATVAACPTSEPEVRSQAGLISQVELQIGTLQRLLAGESWSSKVLGLDGGEGVAQFSGIDNRQVPVPAKAGSTIAVSEATTLMQIVGIDAAFFRFVDVQPDSYPDPVFSSTGVVNADGSVAVPAPTVAGKYVMQVYVQWDAPCLTGAGQQWVVVQVT